jgi:glycosyltransferase involved in cell wall biosynthesis
MTPPLRIEMVLPSLIAGGMEVVTARLVKRLTERGHTVGVTCVLEEGPLADELRAEGIRVKLVPALGLRTNVFPTQLAAWLRQVAPDVVHIHSGVWLKAARAARLAGVRRVVFTEHGALDVEPWYSSLIKRQAARFTDTVIVVSEPLARVMAETHGVPAEKVRVVPNGVDAELFSPGPSRDLLVPWGIAPDSPIIGHVARLATVKNQPLLLEAFARVVKVRPAARLVIVGDGPERELLERRIAELGLSAAAHLIGEHRDVPGLLRSFTMFVLPSKAEGTSMSVLEAMAAGVPVIATAVGGTPDLLDGGRCGQLIPANDVGALADAIVELLDDHERRRTYATAARHRVMRYYDEQAVSDQYESLYVGAETARDHRAPREGLPCAG